MRALLRHSPIFVLYDTKEMNLRLKISLTARKTIRAIHGNSVDTYWYTGESNFGDLQNPLILSHYGFLPIYANRNNAEVVVLGSVLQGIPESYSGIIAGAGLISDQVRKFPYARILAVRGVLTRDRIGAPKDVVLGDPGLLVPFIFRRQVSHKYGLGLVPHYVDKNDERIRNIVSRYPNDVLFIDVQDKPKHVIRKIRQCEFILSSSLHGIVTADAFRIPSRWICLSGKVKGDGFKFKDYRSAFGLDIQPKMIDGTERLSELNQSRDEIPPMLEEVQTRLHEVFKNLRVELEKLRSRERADGE